MPENRPSAGEHIPTVLVGVVPGQPTAVVAAAARFAERFGAELVCASVDVGRYTVDHQPDGTVVSNSIDADLVDDIVEQFDPALRATLAEVLDNRSVPDNHHPVRWSVRALAGGAAQELAGLADELDAAMIVVGTRKAGMRGSLHEFFNGSVAVQLAHRQHRPVVVVPLDPVGPESVLPWQDEGAQA
jgi:nucleotide-binding universal stress UspA family protein